MFFVGIKVTKISNSPSETKAYWNYSNYSFSTIATRLYLAFFVSVEVVVPLIILIVLNLIALFKFKKIIAAKRRIQSNNESKIEKSEIRFTRLILMLTLICIITRTFDAITGVFSRFKFNGFVIASKEYDGITYIFKIVSLFFLFVSHALDGLLYFVYNKQMQYSFKLLKCCKKKIEFVYFLCCKVNKTF